MGNTWTVLTSAATASDIQAALTSASPRGGVQLAAGTWQLGSAAVGLSMDGGVALVGAGREATKLVYTGVGAALQINNGGRMTTSVSVRDLQLEGMGIGNIGIRCGQTLTSPLSANGQLENLDVTNFVTAGIQCDVTQIMAIHRVYISGCGIGLYFAAPTSNGNLQIPVTNSRFEANGIGVKIESCVAVSFRDSIFQLNTAEGFLISYPSNAPTCRMVTLDGCYFEQNNGLGQLAINAQGSAIPQQIYVRNSHFSTKGAGTSYHIAIAKGHVHLQDNDMIDVAPWVSISNSTSNQVEVQDRYIPDTTSWVVGTVANVLWHVRVGSSMTHDIYNNVRGIPTLVWSI